MGALVTCLPGATTTRLADRPPSAFSRGFPPEEHRILSWSGRGVSSHPQTIPVRTFLWFSFSWPLHTPWGKNKKKRSQSETRRANRNLAWQTLRYPGDDSMTRSRADRTLAGGSPHFQHKGDHQQIFSSCDKKSEKVKISRKFFTAYDKRSYKNHMCRK